MEIVSILEKREPLLVPIPSLPHMSRRHTLWTIQLFLMLFLAITTQYHCDLLIAFYERPDALSFPFWIFSARIFLLVVLAVISAGAPYRNFFRSLPPGFVTNANR